jgi:Cytidylate kinase-like family
MTLVAISASYGAAGSRIGSRLASQLGVPFVDRAIPMAEVAGLDVPLEHGSTGEQRGWLERVLNGFVGAAVAVPGPVPADASGTAEDFRRESEELLRAQSASGAGVILGRAAVVVLRSDPRVLRVRLDGPPERRIAQAVEAFGADPDAAAEAVRKLDATHDAYLRHFYGADIHDPALYHVMLDSTTLGIDVCVEMLATAARAHAEALAGSVARG